MERITKKRYGEIVLANIMADQPADWNLSGATHIRVSLPSSIDNMLFMQQNEYQFVDRMLDVTINLKRCTMDLQKSIRIEPVFVSDRHEEILALAKQSFVTDRRFHVETEYNQELADQIIEGWIEEIRNFHVCIYKEKIIGFLALKEADDRKSAGIYLAAVDERYRTSGAAMSLYAKALLIGQEKGYQNITGYISSYNTAVMNVYAHFGGIFSNPQDIYIKKLEHTGKGL